MLPFPTTQDAAGGAQTQTTDSQAGMQTLKTGRDDQQPQPPQPAGTRPSRKRKSPPDNNHQDSQPPQPPPPPPPTAPHILPPMMHPLPGGLPPGYQYAVPADFNPAALQPPPPPPDVNQQAAGGQTTGPGGRPLSTSKRAEQNRKAQRAFRERRDQ
jgi:hypothetical protein